ncbi:Arc family DNA-binding protein [Pseudomonas sp.]|uniref:Arc family DNA-binding protein n=1 Tax=Pseudomonas sp. TaxID=306 RepID=UPI0029123A1A|nr:Arc family DNA-binding protein [Pseudomonas sp.]MDU4254593.1 Arc family DNA-binding protein [Pseudomonas sp.]
MTSYLNAAKLPLAAKLLGIDGSADYNSRTADKFQLRLTPELHKAGRVLAREQLRSFNSELIAAILSGLDGHAHLAGMLALTKAQLGSRADEVLSTVTLHDPSQTELFGTAKYILRFPESIREAVMNIAGDEGTSMNRWINDQTLIWLNLNKQLSALLDAYVEQTRAS